MCCWVWSHSAAKLIDKLINYCSYMPLSSGQEKLLQLRVVDLTKIKFAQDSWTMRVFEKIDKSRTFDLSCMQSMGLLVLYESSWSVRFDGNELFLCWIVVQFIAALYLRASLRDEGAWVSVLEGWSYDETLMSKHVANNVHVCLVPAGNLCSYL
jgi:hypothetical protein